jgi:nitroimidazol reductase NimA-like FMN-containing flavoprotein (pyridoxamine 5'-phosphate oxidase superfamily)
MLLDAAGLEILDREQCLKLAATVPIGRVVFTSRALPMIQPVNFVIEDDGVVIRTGAGSKLTAAVRGAVVAFQVDDFNSELHTGWSVSITGHALLVTGSPEIQRLEAEGPQTWVAEERTHFIKIMPELVSGRRVLQRSLPTKVADPLAVRTA